MEPMAKTVERINQVIIRFAGDSGDGMQLTGDRFTSETAVFGNDLATLPDFPAEIRAPAGSLPGVSGFQVHFADHDILTPGDQPSVLVAMNPAALKVNVADLAKGGTIIANTDAFNDRNLQKAGYESNPLRSEEHTSELQSLAYLVCRLLLEKKNTNLHSSSRPSASTTRSRRICQRPSRSPSIPCFSQQNRPRLNSRHCYFNSCILSSKQI